MVAQFSTGILAHFSISIYNLYDEKGCMVHGSIKGTKDYLLETWRYHTNRHSKGNGSTRIRPCTTSRAFSFV